MEANAQRACGCVLVVEDDSALRSVIRFNLEQAGMDVVAAADGCQAWSKLQEQPVDVVVTDIDMPRMTGIELCRRMRADPRFVDVPVMMLTAKGLEVDADRLRTDLGVLEVVFKPFSPKLLTSSVARYLREAAGRTP